MESLIKELKNTLSRISVDSLLVNGNVEKQLKFLMASGHDSKPNWYLMDKQFDIGKIADDIPDFLKNNKGDLRAKHEIDLVLFKGEDVLSVAEFKCTFVTDSMKVVTDAIKKAKTTQYLARQNHDDEFWKRVGVTVDQYIVHFLLTSNPRYHADGSARPSWATDRFKILNDFKDGDDACNKAVNKVVEHYKLEYEGKTELIPVIENKLSAILVKVA